MEMWGILQHIGSNSMSVENVMMMVTYMIVTYDCWLQASRDITWIYPSDYFSQILLVKSQPELPPCHLTLGIMKMAMINITHT